MSGDLLAFAGVAFAAVVGLFGGLRSGGRSASAAEVTALGGRLDAQANRIDDLETRLDDSERRERLLRDYAYTLQAELRKHGIEIPEPPKGLL